MSQDVMQYVISGTIIVIVLALRFRSMRKTRPLNPDRLWIGPLLLALMALAAIVLHPPGALGLALGGFGLVVGGLIGWQRGRLIRIDRDPATGALSQTVSPAAMFLLVGIILIRFVARAYFAGNPTAAANGGMDEHTLMITDVALLFAVGLIGMTRIEMMLRARRILAALDAAG
ncbi:MAG: hypothetical protein ABIR51_05720 [Sphingomicrobium sp.]